MQAWDAVTIVLTVFLNFFSTNCDTYDLIVLPDWFFWNCTSETQGSALYCLTLISFVLPDCDIFRVTWLWYFWIARPRDRRLLAPCKCAGGCDDVYWPSAWAAAAVVASANAAANAVAAASSNVFLGPSLIIWWTRRLESAARSLKLWYRIWNWRNAAVLNNE